MGLYWGFHRIVEMNMNFTVPRLLNFAIALVVGLQVAGCYTDYGPVEAERRPISLSRVPSHLQAGDKLKINGLRGRSAHRPI